MATVSTDPGGAVIAPDTDWFAGGVKVAATEPLTIATAVIEAAGFVTVPETARMEPAFWVVKTEVLFPCNQAATLPELGT